MKLNIVFNPTTFFITMVFNENTVFFAKINYYCAMCTFILYIVLYLIYINNVVFVYTFIVVLQFHLFAPYNVHTNVFVIHFVVETTSNTNCMYKYLVQCENEYVLLDRCFEKMLCHSICTCMLHVKENFFYHKSYFVEFDSKK